MKSINWTLIKWMIHRPMTSVPISKVLGIGGILSAR
jgi:hypothetical protein